MRNYNKLTHSFMEITSYCCQILLKFELFRQIFKKYKICSKIKFSENPSILPIQYSPSLKAKYPPFNQHSILISQDSKSHSCVHNSVTAPILRQMNPCHILLLRTFFDLFPYYSAVTKFLV